MRVRSLDAKHLLLVLLALAPGVSTSRTPGDLDRPTSMNRSESSVAAHDGIRGASCRDLRDAELILARNEVRLLDQLASQSGRPQERVDWKGEIDRTKASLEDVDRALAAARCPTRSGGG